MTEKRIHELMLLGETLSVRYTEPPIYNVGVDRITPLKFHKYLKKNKHLLSWRTEVNNKNVTITHYYYDKTN